VSETTRTRGPVGWRDRGRKNGRTCDPGRERFTLGREERGEAVRVFVLLLYPRLGMSKKLEGKRQSGRGVACSALRKHNLLDNEKNGRDGEGDDNRTGSDLKGQDRKTKRQVRREGGKGGCPQAKKKES